MTTSSAFPMLGVTLTLAFLLHLLLPAAGQLSFTSPSSVIYGTPALSSPRLSTSGGSSLFALDRFGNRAVRFAVASHSVVTSYIATSPSFAFPSAVEQDKLTGNVWVADSTSRIVQFSITGAELTSWSLVSSYTLNMAPYALASDRLGYLWVGMAATSSSQRTLKVLKVNTTTGQVVDVWNSSSVLLGLQVSSTPLLTVVGNSTLYLTATNSSAYSTQPLLLTIDTLNSNITSFYTALTFPADVPVAASLDSTATALYVSLSASSTTPIPGQAVGANYVQRFVLNSPAAPTTLSGGLWSDATELAADAKQNVYFTSVLKSNVLYIYNTSYGTSTYTYIVPPLTPASSGTFLRPTHIAVDSRGSIYATYSSRYTSPLTSPSYPPMLIARTLVTGQPAGFINTTVPYLSRGIGIDSRDRLLSLTSEVGTNVSTNTPINVGWLRVFDAPSGVQLVAINLSSFLSYYYPTIDWTATAFYYFALDSADNIYVSFYNSRTTGDDRILQLRLNDISVPSVVRVLYIVTQQSPFAVDPVRQLLYRSALCGTVSSCTSVYMYNLTTSRLLTSFTTATNGVAINPTGFRVDAAGRLYVSDSGKPRVLVLQPGTTTNSNGTFSVLSIVANYTSYNALSSAYLDVSLAPAGSPDQQVYVADVGGVVTFPSYTAATASSGSSSSGGSVAVLSSSAANATLSTGGSSSSIPLRSSSSSASPSSNDTSTGSAVTSTPLSNASSSASPDSYTSSSATAAAESSSSAEHVVTSTPEPHTSTHADSGMDSSSTHVPEQSSSHMEPVRSYSSSSSGGSVQPAPDAGDESSSHTVAIAASIVVGVVVLFVLAAMLLAWRAGWNVPCLCCCSKRGSGEVVEGGSSSSKGMSLKRMVAVDPTVLMTDRDGYQYRGKPETEGTGSTQLSARTVKW